jgi:trans-2,3-dihydro-3-hydroxyanthranilate isomerase
LDYKEVECKPLSIVDVFGRKKYQGNQLAIVNVRNVITTGEMQKFAREINFSETTYILSEQMKRGGYDVRIFTPATEVPFAGHPTLGTAYIIQQAIIKRPVKQIILNLKAGQIPVDILYKRGNPDILWMTQINPVFGRAFKSGNFAAILSLPSKSVDNKFPIQEVSTGLPFIIVPLTSLDAMQNIHVDKSLYFKLIENTQARAILVFCPQTVDSGNDLHVRVFCDYYGIPEDPATGSANGCLAGYLVKHRYFNKSEINVRVEQGIEIGRPSLLHLKAHTVNEKHIEVKVGGKVVSIVSGELS